MGLTSLQHSHARSIPRNPTWSQCLRNRLSVLTMCLLAPLGRGDRLTKQWTRMVPPGECESATSGSTVERSNQLSYGGMLEGGFRGEPKRRADALQAEPPLLNEKGPGCAPGPSLTRDPVSVLGSLSRPEDSTVTICATGRTSGIPGF